MLKMKTVECQVVEVLSEHLPIAPQAIQQGARLVEDLYIDSIGVIEVVIALNERFSIDLPVEVVAQWRRVVDICDGVKRAVESARKVPTGGGELSTNG